jgi:hypothetical protein
MFNVTAGDELAENPEHVPLLITPATAASKHHKPSAAATAIAISTNVTNGNGLIENSDQARPIQISPVVLSSCTPAVVMRSRLNQYKTSGSFKNNVFVNFDSENGSTTTITEKSTSKGGKKKKKSADI